jgi:hypothetical protein
MLPGGLKREFFTLLLYSASFALPFGVILFGNICYGYLVPLIVGAVLLVFVDGGQNLFVNILFSIFVFSQLFINLFLLLSFVFSFQKRTACKFFGQYDYCAEEPYMTIERLILFLFSFTLVCFSSIKMVWGSEGGGLYEAADDVER